MKKRKVIGLIMALILLVIFSGCTQNVSDPVLKAAKEMAYADFSLDKLTISGMEYIELTEKHLVNPDRYYQKMVLFHDGVEYSLDDIVSLDEEELSSLREAFYQALRKYELGGPETLKSVVVSEVFDDINFSFKHVNVRGELTIAGKDAYVFRHYTFKEEGNRWLVLTCAMYSDFIDEPRVPRTIKKYLEYDGKQIEYTTIVELAE